MRKALLLMGIIAIMGLSSCSYWIAAPYTNVDKITKVKPGMNIDQVNSVLGVSPYNIYHIQDDGGSVITYKYRIKERRMNVPARMKRQMEVIASEEAQTTGAPWYKGEEHTIYVLFKDLKMKSLISDEGLNKSEYMLIKDNNLRIITKKEFNSLQKVENSANTNLLILNEKNIVQSIDLPKEKTEESNTVIVDDSDSNQKQSFNKNKSNDKKSDKKHKKGVGIKVLKIYLGVGVIVALLAIII